jgi:hypothetical protein
MAKFKKGEVANPAGRPKGIPDSRTALRALLQPHAEELIKKAVDLALEGDQAALRMCLDRLCPTIKATSEPLTISLSTDGTLDEQAAAVFKLAANGGIPTDDAAQLVSMLSSQCRIRELTDMENRIKALETQVEERSNGNARK